MTNEHRGGRWALAGFLYQIVGMLSVVARASHQAEFSYSNGAAEIDSLLTLPNVGDSLQAHHEWIEDATFTTEDECILVQFKYSSTGRPIRVGEARSITKKLREGAERASNRGYSVTACVLFTNRRLTSRGGRAAKQHWESEDEEQPYELRLHMSGPIGSLIDDLARFARKYGLYDREIEAGINRLIGDVLSQAGDLFDKPFDRSHFTACLVGSESAQPLILDRIRPLSDQRLEILGDRIGIQQWHGSPIQRTRLQDVVKAINEGRALIGLCGPGGCGKSTLIWQLLTNLPSGHCCDFTYAEEVVTSWIKNTVHSWRGLPGNSEDTRREAIERLLIANPSSTRPILWLGLDGIDEGDLSPSRQNHIRDILNWFWHQDLNHTEAMPPATLIVSSRNERRLSQFLRLPGGPLRPSRRPLTIEVSAFTERERNIAAEQETPELYQRVAEVSAPGWSNSGSQDPEVWGAEAHGESLDSLDEALWSSLKHPAMWQAFLALDRETQRRAGEGNAEAQLQLAHGFIQWFGFKLRMRRGVELEELLRDHCYGLLEVLAAVARCSELDAFNRWDPDWVESARQTPIGISRSEANALYKESCSAGLIEEDAPRTWRWRHSLVYDYLMIFQEGELQDG